MNQIETDKKDSGDTSIQAPVAPENYVELKDFFCSLKGWSILS